MTTSGRKRTLATALLIIVVPSLLLGEVPTGELLPIPPHTYETRLRSLYAQAQGHIEKKEFNEGATIYLNIIRDYSGTGYEVHRRWSCYALFRLFWFFKIAESNRGSLANCPSDLVARLYGDVDRDPILLFHKYPKFLHITTNISASANVAVEFDITQAGAVENVVVVESRMANKDTQKFVVEYYETQIYLPKIEDGIPVATAWHDEFDFEAAWGWLTLSP